MSKTKTPKKKSKLGFIGILSSFFSTFLTTVISIFALVFMAAFLFNINMYTVRTGSMEPTYHVNSIVFVKAVDFSELEVGDAITFVKDNQGTLVTHRIISIDSAAQSVNTKGDANATRDGSPVLAGNIVGRVVFNFPIGGNVLEYVVAQENRAVVFGALAVFGVISFILDKLEKKFSVESEEKKKSDANAENKDTEKKIDELMDEMKLDALLGTAPQTEVKEPEPPPSTEEKPKPMVKAQEQPKVETVEKVAEAPTATAVESEAASASSDEALAEVLASALRTVAADNASGRSTMSPDVKLKIEKLIEKLETVSSPAPKWGSLWHKLSDVLFIGLVSTLCGGDDFEHMADTCAEKLDWFKKRLELANGVPDLNTFRKVFERMSPHKLGELLRSITSSDGEDSMLLPCSEVNVWVADNQLMLGQPSADIPELISLLDASGCIVSVDTDAFQKSTVDAICQKGADYIINLKSDDSSLFDTVRLWFEADKPSFAVTKTENAYGRLEKREYCLETNVSLLADRAGLTKLGGIGMVKSSAAGKDGDGAQYCSYFITSLKDVNRFANEVRNHWSMETRQSWQLGISCSDTAAVDNSHANLELLQQKSAALLNAADFGKSMSLSRKKLCVAMNSEKLELVFTRKKAKN